MKSKITGFHQDAEGDWVAELACGHRQHVRHDPPWRTCLWVLTAQGRQEKIGAEVDCPDCGPPETLPGETPPAETISTVEGRQR